MPAEPVTAEPPLVQDVLPPPGTYPLRCDRCVVEVSAWPWWGRFTALRGELVVAEPGSVTVVVDTGSLRTGVPLSARALLPAPGLLAGRLRTLEFAAEGVEVVDGRLRISGAVTAGDVVRELTLSARIVHRDDASVVISAEGVLPPVGVRSGRRSRPGLVARPVSRRRLTVRIAAEFASGGTS
jgi:hypothetical protein